MPLLLKPIVAITPGASVVVVMAFARRSFSPEIPTDPVGCWLTLVIVIFFILTFGIGVSPVVSLLRVAGGEPSAKVTV